MRRERLPVIAANEGSTVPMRWYGPFVHVSDLATEELADWIPLDSDEGDDETGSTPRGAQAGWVTGTASR